MVSVWVIMCPTDDKSATAKESWREAQAEHFFIGNSWCSVDHHKEVAIAEVKWPASTTTTMPPVGGFPVWQTVTCPFLTCLSVSLPPRTTKKVKKKKSSRPLSLTCVTISRRRAVGSHSMHRKRTAKEEDLEVSTRMLVSQCVSTSFLFITTGQQWRV